MPKDMPQLSAKDAPDLGSFNWEDPFLLEEQLSEEERMIRDSARAYAQEKLQPRIRAAKVALESARPFLSDYAPCLALKTNFYINGGWRFGRADPASPWPWDHEHISV